MLNIGAMISLVVQASFSVNGEDIFKPNHPVRLGYSWINNTLKKLREWNSIPGRLMFVISYLIQYLVCAIYTWVVASVFPYYYLVKLMRCCFRWLIYGTWAFEWKLKKSSKVELSCEDCYYYKDGKCHSQPSPQCYSVENMPKN